MSQEMDRLRRLVIATASRAVAMHGAYAARVAPIEVSLFKAMEAARSGPTPTPAVAMAAAAALGRFVAAYAPEQHRHLILSHLQECVELSHNEHRKPVT